MSKVFAIFMAFVMMLVPTITMANSSVASDFEPFAVDYEKVDEAGETVVLQGILMSEADYHGLIYKVKDLTLDLEYKTAEADSWKLRWEVDMQVKNSHIGMLELELSKTNTWYARNKGGVGFGLGVFVTVISSIGMAYAFAGAGNIAGGN